jgi:hypothetical protein
MFAILYLHDSRAVEFQDEGKDREKAKEIREYGLCQMNPGTGQRVIDTIRRKPYWRKP